MANQSLTISFQSVSDVGELTVDLDDKKNLDTANGGSGRTSNFIYGDEVFFRVFTNPVTGISVSCYTSDGTLTAYEAGTAVYTRDQTFDTDESTNPEILTFTEPYAAQGGIIANNTVSLEFPVVSGFQATLLSSTGCGSVTLNALNPTQAEASQAGPGVYKASYTCHYWSFSIQLTSAPVGWPSDQSYPIVIVVVGV